MDVYYQNHRFCFERSRDDSMTGKLLLDQAQRNLLAALLGAQDETWGLDRDGMRLSEDQLFEFSPWSLATRTGHLKLLCRFIDISTGSVIFNTPDSYPGDTSSWVLAGDS